MWGVFQKSCFPSTYAFMLVKLGSLKQCPHVDLDGNGNRTAVLKSWATNCELVSPPLEKAWCSRPCAGGLHTDKFLSALLLSPRAPTLGRNAPSGDSTSTSTFLISLGHFFFFQNYKRSRNIFHSHSALKLRGPLGYRDCDEIMVSKYQKDEEHGLWRQDNTIQIPVLPHVSCVSLGKPLNFSVP